MLFVAPTATAADWIAAPSYYTHNPETGERVNQYSQIGPFYLHPSPTHEKSGYHHFRSSIRVGGSADNYHQVERYGGEVRPYGEWQRPFRPYSAPYSQWGPTYHIWPGRFPRHGGVGPPHLQGPFQRPFQGAPAPWPDDDD